MTHHAASHCTARATSGIPPTHRLFEVRLLGMTLCSKLKYMKYCCQQNASSGHVPVRLLPPIPYTNPSPRVFAVTGNTCFIPVSSCAKTYVHMGKRGTTRGARTQVNVCASSRFMSRLGGLAGGRVFGEGGQEEGAAGGAGAGWPLQH